MEIYSMSAINKKRNIEHLLEINGCTICERATRNLCYHHVRAKKKEMSSLWSSSYGSILCEIVKCLPLCNDCHICCHSENSLLYASKEVTAKYTEENINKVYNEFWEDSLYECVDGMLHQLTDEGPYGPARIKSRLKKIPGDLIVALQKCDALEINWFDNMLDTDPIQYVKQNCTIDCKMSMCRRKIIDYNEFSTLVKLY